MSSSEEKPSKTLNEVLRFRCSNDEKKLIKMKADQSGMVLSEYLRRMALKGRITVKQNDVDFETVYLLKKLGNNLNQQTKMMHSTGTLPADLKRTLQKLESIMDKLMEKI